MNLKKVGLVLVILLAIEIFYISSMPLNNIGPPSPKIVPIAYHFIVFTLFSFFLFMSLGNNCIEDISKGDIWFVYIFSILYAVSDELHQLFVPFRTCTYFDILIDFLGICFGIILYYIVIYKD